MAPQASKKCGLLPPDYSPIASCKSNGIYSKNVRGAFSVF
jgi:hypothetical protein